MIDLKNNLNQLQCLMVWWVLVLQLIPIIATFRYLSILYLAPPQLLYLWAMEVYTLP